MKLKKIISLISAFALVGTMFSAFTVAEAASLGGKPVIKAEFAGYDKKNDTVAFALIDITIDMTAAEALEEYFVGLDEVTWAEVKKGNGVSALGVTWNVPSGFTYFSSVSKIPSNGLTYAATNITLGAKDNPADYYTTPVSTATLAYKVDNFDTSGKIEFDVNLTDMMGDNTADNATWSYYANKDQITLVNCDIPSCNEWLNPTPSKTEVSAETTAQAGHTDAANNTAFAYYVKLGADASQKTGYWTAKFDGTAYKHNQTFEVPTISGEGTANYGLIYKGDKTISEVKFVLE